LVEDITGQQETEGEEEEEVEEELAEENPAVGQKRKTPGAPSKQTSVEIMLPHIPDVVIVVEDMLGKVEKLKYADHDVTDTTKFPDLVQEIYLENKEEVGPSGNPILEPTQWITGLYNSGIMNLLEIPHFGCGKDVGNCVKQLLERVHGGILWMDRSVHIDVDLIEKITGFPTSGVKPEDYLENKARDKEIAEEVKAQFGTNRGNRGIVIKDINDPAMRFSMKLMACKLLRKCRKEEAPTGVIAAVVQCAKGIVLSWVPYLLNQFLIDCRDAQDNGT
jgi:hypothetical protein